MGYGENGLWVRRGFSSLGENRLRVGKNGLRVRRGFSSLSEDRLWVGKNGLDIAAGVGNGDGESNSGRQGDCDEGKLNQHSEHRYLKSGLARKSLSFTVSQYEKSSNEGHMVLCVLTLNFGDAVLIAEKRFGSRSQSLSCSSGDLYR